MLNLYERLIKLEEEDREIKVAIAGAGLMGRGLVSQLSLVKGQKPSFLVDRTIEKAIDAYIQAGVAKDDIEIVTRKSQLNSAIERGKYLVAEDISLLSESDYIDVVVDCTGSPIAGAEIASSAIDNLKDIVMLNVETDMLIGPILYEKAREKGLVYTGTAGDEPGSVMELYNFAQLSGFEILAIGKGKNNRIDLEANPDSVYQDAKANSLKPQMLTGFVDGTNTMIEMATMGNATGFLPDVIGGHGISSSLEDMTKNFSLKSQGGILNNYKIVDYVNGIAPGVFVIVSSSQQEVRKQMKFLKMGDGPNYLLYRPFHLTSLETPISIARAFLERQVTIAPKYGQVCEVVSFAKKDLIAGERLDGIGGYTIYGKITSYKEAREEGLLPIGLVNKGAKLLKDVKKGDFIKRDMVELDETSKLYKLRQAQDRW